MDVKFERTSAVAVARGLLAVRYASSGSVKDFPIAIVKAATQSESVVEIISAPGTTLGCLEKPGDCVVVRVQDAAKLEIGLRRSAPNGSLEASFNIEVLGSGKAPEAVAEDAQTVAEPQRATVVSDFRPSAATASTDLTKLSIIAHVAMRGDVEVSEDQWIAGPTAPAPVEGLLLRCADAGRLGIESQVLVAGAQQWSDWVGAGGYAGTRGRGLPLLAVRFRLTGVETQDKEIVGDALFLGAPALAKSGRQIEFISLTGSDPLVGLKLGVRTAEKSPGAQNTEGPWRDRGSRVRVFRSSTGG